MIQSELPDSLPSAYKMSSGLRYSVTPTSTTGIPTIRRQASAPPPPKKQKMSLTQTYMLATVARRQLQKEAARADHDLRLLVGHANLLDGLMLDLANAEQEQESWFNQSVSTASTAAEQSKHVQWAADNSIPEEAIDEEYYDEDSDDDESEDEAVSIAQRAVRTRVPSITTTSIDEGEDQEMDDEFAEELSLTRSPSHNNASSSSPSSTSAPSSPPELMHEFDSEDSESDDDDSLPSSPEMPAALDAFSRHQREQALSSSTPSKQRQPALDLSLFDHESQQAVPIAAC